MTKRELAAKFAQEESMPLTTAKKIVEIVFREMASSIVNEERVEIRGFGTFNVKYHGGYHGRNPRNGETVYVRPKKLPFFRVARELKRRVNNKDAGKSDSPA